MTNRLRGYERLTAVTMVIKPLRSRSARVAGIAGVVAATGLLLAACGSGPSQAGSAAIVGDDVISLDAVQQELTAAVATQTVAQQAQSQGQLDAISREIISERILHQVTAAAAAKYNIAVSDQDVDAYIAKAGGIDKLASPVLSAQDQRATARDQLIEAVYAARFADNLAVTFDYFAADTQAHAITAAKEVAAKPGEFAPLVSAESQQGGDANTGVTYTLKQYLTNSSGALFGPMFAEPANTVFVFSPNLGSSQEVWYVMRIDKVAGDTPVPTPSTAVASANPALLATVGELMFRSVAETLPIRISPRYGTWDPTSMQVVSSTDTAPVQTFPAGTAK